ncbi:MAG: hypothetical protein H7X88_01710 [Gloeobacteraceae cyanobacterium ES-bin-316]|nr:hypothetical protein [Ferruginibacter sp.]
MTEVKKATPAKKSAPVKKAAKVKKAPVKKAAPVKKIEPDTAPTPVKKEPKEISFADLKAIAIGRGFEVGNIGIEKLKDMLDLPEPDEKILFNKTKNAEKATPGVYKGWFKCKISGIIYAQLTVAGNKKSIKQMWKVLRVK